MFFSIMLFITCINCNGQKNKILQCLQFSVGVFKSIVKCRMDNEHPRERSNIMFDQMDHTCKLQMQQTSIVLLFFSRESHF